MNIHTASLYAKQGYKIFRQEWWDDAIDDTARLLYVVEESDGSYSFMSDAAHYYILSLDDCLADDWDIITT